MGDKADESCLVRVNRVKASHEDVSEDEEVNRTLSDAHVAVITGSRLSGTHDVVFWTDLNPVVFNEQVEAGEESMVTSGHVHFPMLRSTHVLLGVPEDMPKEWAV